MTTRRDVTQVGRFICALFEFWVGEVSPYAWHTPRCRYRGGTMLPPLRTPALRAPPCAGGNARTFCAKKCFRKTTVFLEHIAREKNGAVATFELLKKRLT